MPAMPDDKSENETTDTFNHIFYNKLLYNKKNRNISYYKSMV